MTNGNGREKQITVVITKGVWVIMRRFIACLLALLFLAGFCSAEETNKQIVVNGVTIVMTEDDRIVKPIEKDGVVYVPLAAFLRAINMDYTEGEDGFAISTGTSEKSAEKEDYYSQLSDEEKKFLDNFILCVSSFKNPASIRLINVYNHKGSPGLMYFVEVSAQNGFGGNSITRYICMFGIIEEAKNDTEFKKQKEETGFDISLLNKALGQKLEELGYK